MVKFASLLESVFGKKISNMEGAGAAGGLGAGCMAFLNAELKSGIEIVFDLSNARTNIRNANLVITGEGKIDHQSLSGKVIAGVGELCRVYNKKAIAFCGVNELNDSELQQINIQTAIPITPADASLNDAYENAYQNLKDKAFELTRSL
jgi:glycerate kinase